MKCEKCGQIITTNVRFCPNCGANLIEESSDVKVKSINRYSESEYIKRNREKRKKLTLKLVTSIVIELVLILIFIFAFCVFKNNQIQLSESNLLLFISFFYILAIVNFFAILIRIVNLATFSGYKSAYQNYAYIITGDNRLIVMQIDQKYKAMKKEEIEYLINKLRFEYKVDDLYEYEYEKYGIIDYFIILNIEEIKRESDGLNLSAQIYYYDNNSKTNRKNIHIYNCYDNYDDIEKLITEQYNK